MMYSKNDNSKREITQSNNANSNYKKDTGKLSKIKNDIYCKNGRPTLLTKINIGFILKIFIIINTITPILSSSYCITLKLKEIGIQPIIFNEYANKIKVEINGIEKSLSENAIEITETINRVDLICLSPFTNCDNMFKDLSNITEIDLSNVDA